MKVRRKRLLEHAEYPRPHPHTRCRILGPELVNGMQTWRVFRYDRALDGRIVERQVGDRCLSFREAERRVQDVLSGRRVVYFGPHRFEPKPYAGQAASG